MRSWLLHIVCLWICFGANPNLQAQATWSVSENKLILSPLSKGISPNIQQISEQVNLYVGDTIPNQDSGFPSVLGEWVQNGDSLVFTPAFPLQLGQTYIIDIPRGEPFSFVLPRDNSPKPYLVGIYPTADTLPANQLKFYLEFSLPMREGFADRYVQVFDELGNPLPSPFVPLSPELWDENHQRLTLWLDPGRIKRGLMSQERFGEILIPGQVIRVRVDSAWEDLSGRAMGKVFEAHYVVGGADYASPDPQSWTLAPPETPQDTLALVFGEPLDYALLQHTITIWNTQHQQVLGSFSFSPGEEAGFFVPIEPWQKGRFFIYVETILEDLGGNNLNRPFDLDLLKEKTERPEKEVVVLEFWVKNGQE